MREFVYHLAGNVEYCSATSLLHRAVIHYALKEHKISYHEFVKDLKVESPDELRMQLTLSDARRRNLQQDLNEARYELRQAREKLKTLGWGDN